MYQLIFVAIGGALGAVSRFKLVEFVSQRCPAWQFPIGTLLVNILGCLLAGLLLRLAERTELVTPEMRLLLFTGILGAFTTFSAFGIETLLLMKRGEFGLAVTYVVLSIVGGIGGVWIGVVKLP